MKVEVKFLIVTPRKWALLRAVGASPCVQKWVSQHTTICLGSGVKIAVKLEVTQLIIVCSACGELGVPANLIFVARVRFLSVTRAWQNTKLSSIHVNVPQFTTHSQLK